MPNNFVVQHLGRTPLERVLDTDLQAASATTDWTQFAAMYDASNMQQQDADATAAPVRGPTHRVRSATFRSRNA